MMGLETDKLVCALLVFVIVLLFGVILYLWETR